MQKGTIARIMDGKGYGFIDVEGSDKDLFFHANEVKDPMFDDLKPGNNVEFEVSEAGEKGPSAVNVSRV